MSSITRRDLKEVFGIKGPTLKKRDMDFLPPDPTAGKQSGYARQYSPNEAFRLLLAGHLVSDLKFSTPEARQVIDKIDDWLLQNGHLPECPEFEIHELFANVQTFSIQIVRDQVHQETFHYRAIGRILAEREPTDMKDVLLCAEKYTMQFIEGYSRDGRSDFTAGEVVSTLSITEYLSWFLACIGDVLDTRRLRNFITCQNAVFRRRSNHG